MGQQGDCLATVWGQAGNTQGREHSLAPDCLLLSYPFFSCLFLSSPVSPCFPLSPPVSSCLPLSPPVFPLSPPVFPCPPLSPLSPLSIASVLSCSLSWLLQLPCKCRPAGSGLWKYIRTNRALDTTDRRSGEGHYGLSWLECK